VGDIVDRVEPAAVFLIHQLANSLGYSSLRWSIRKERWYELLCADQLFGC